MKTQIFLSFNIEEESWSVLRESVENAGRANIVVFAPFTAPLFLSYCAMRLYENDPQLQHLRAALSDMGIKWSERRELIFTDAELEAYPLLWLSVGTAPRGYGGPTYGTEYDLSQACPQCGTGAIQITPLRLNRTEIPRRGAIFQTLDREKLVSPKLAQLLNHAEFRGLKLRRAQSHSGGKDLPWVQLISDVELPPMSASSKGILREGPCPHCWRDGYFHSQQPIELEYSSRQVDVNALPDIVHTYEHFGNSVLREPFKNSHFAQPLLLIKPRVFRFFRQQKVRELEFVPVKII
jgi:hypothetical protein